MKLHAFASMALAAFVGSQGLAQTNELSTVSIGTQATAGGTANGVAVITQRIGTALNQPGSIGNNLAGIQYVAGQIPLTGAPASVAFYALTGAAIPGGAANPATAFTSFGTLTSPTGVVTYSDVASKLTPDSYSGMTFAAADLGFGAGNFYSIHHTPSNVDYLAEIVPGTGTSSSIADLKPMSWQGPTAGTPASPGSNGFFGLAWATGILSAGAPYADESLYYLRTDSLGHTQFGVMIPALTGASSDTLDLTTAIGSYGASGYSTLAFCQSVQGDIPANQFYYLRLDSITGNTILGRLNPSLVAGTRTVSDIANLGGVFNTLNFAADATGPAGAWGSAQFYVTGSLAPGAQSISFEAIPNHNVGDVFTVTPTASSGLDIDVTVVSGPASVQTTGVSGATPTSLRVFTVTTTGPGIVTLQARQAGQTASPAFTANLLRQSFDVLGLPSVTSATAAPGTVGAPFTFNITATGSPTSYAASPLPAGLALDAATGAIMGTPVAVGVTVVSVTATNATGTSNAATLTLTVSAAGTAPVITSPIAEPGTVGTVFATYAITATGSPTSYAATGLPPGLSLNAATGAISGTPTAAGVSVVTLGATNGTGTGTATLTLTIAAAGVVPVITSTTSGYYPGTVGSVFATYTIAATGSPTSFSAVGLPPGLTLNAATGAINGTPTAAGTYTVTAKATNSSGTGTSVFAIAIAPPAAVPVITSTASGNNPANVGTEFPTYTVGATGSPTSYTATGLPPGLTLNALTGAINGTPTTAGTYVVALSATNSAGTGTSSLTITVAAANALPVFTNPATAPGTVGTAINYTLGATGLPTSYTATGLPPGLTLNTLTGGITGTPTTAGTYVVTVTATNSTGTSTTSITFTVAGAGTAPVITGPATAPGGVGTAVYYTIGATGSPTSYTATGLPPGLTLNTLTGTITGTPTTAGTYVATVNATNSTGTSTTTLTWVITPLGFSHIVNFSARALSGSGSDTLVVGFVVLGDAKNLLIRGIGPDLASFGVTDFLAAPILTLFDASGGVLATDSGWGVNSSGQNDAALISSTAASVGAFSLPSGSLDSALLVTVNNGAHTTGLLTTNGAAGVGLIEIYDTGGNPNASLVNVSARMNVTAGSGVLIAGLVIGGSESKTVLIRGIGPTLSEFGVSGVLADPQITVFSGSTQIASNANWNNGTGASSAAQLVSTSAEVGAFPLASGSRDAALIVTLQPGPYTVQVTSVSGATGVALIEVYDTQD
ncbi:MAG: putative Ig domain-containing protein [Opitutaceae bacterium]